MKKFLKNNWYLFLVVFGLLVFIPDPLDFIFGVGEVIEGLSLCLGIILAIIEVNK